MNRFRDFSPRKETPAGLEVKVDGRPIIFLVDPATGKVSPPNVGAWGWVKGFLWQDLEKYLQNQSYEVKELKDVAPVLS